VAVRRIVANLPARDPAALAGFYQKLLGLETVMDLGFLVTLAGGEAPIQLGLGREGGADTPLPVVSIEVDDLEDTLARARGLGAPIVHGPTREDWGVRRFFLRDPEGTLVNILSHDDSQP
jgi:catechol 2,3-dioxygenase-like lactoylglutathione lyase family enzyme